MEKYDILVVGTGTAAQTFISDIISNNKKFSIAVVGKNPAGGVCALEGCNAKKFPYEIAHMMLHQKHLMGKGIVQKAIPNWKETLRQKNAFVDSISEQTIKRLKKQGIVYYDGTAKFVNSTTMYVDDKFLSAKYIVLATGARPRELDIVGKEFLFTNKEFLNQNKLKQEHVFIGGGFVNAEFATIVTGFGSKATIVNHSKHLLGLFDRDMVEMWQLAARKDDIDFKLNVEVNKIQKHNKNFEIFLSDGSVLNAGCVINGIGRVPNIEELNVNKAGIVVNSRGIVVDIYMQTNKSNIFAIGDCADAPQLARVADYEAHVVATVLMRILSGKGGLVCTRYNVAPVILFIYPQLAMVGATEKTLKDQGMKLNEDYERSMGTQLRWANFLRDGCKFASYKILVNKEHKILGAHILSPNPAGCINAVKTAMMNNKTVEELWGETVLSPYPTYDSDLSYMLNSLVSKTPIYKRIKY